MLDAKVKPEQTPPEIRQMKVAGVGMRGGGESRRGDSQSSRGHKTVARVINWQMRPEGKVFAQTSRY